MIRVAICDDDKMIACEIKKMLSICCEKIGIVVDMTVYDDGRDLENDILRGEPFDLIYLDIQMQGQDGIVTARNLRRFGKSLYIIFVSEYDKYIEEIFDVGASDFILKPIKPERFEKTFRRVNDRIGSKTKYFEFVYNSRIKRIPFNDITYFESNGRKILIHLKDGSIEAFNSKMDDVEKEVKAKTIGFIRIHQSFLVNYDFILNRSRNEIMIISGERLPISRVKQKKIQIQYSGSLR